MRRRWREKPMRGNIPWGYGTRWRCYAAVSNKKYFDIIGENVNRHNPVSVNSRFSCFTSYPFTRNTSSYPGYDSDGL
ncbi:MAG: hypothetical protein IT420_02765 [Candidatus Brocadia sp.]|nr:hypothetical protein [Candidatus Brocadia sp.]